MPLLAVLAATLVPAAAQAKAPADAAPVRAVLRLSEELEGRVSVREATGGMLLELHKKKGYAVEVGLPDGPYEVALEREGRAFKTQVSLSAPGTWEVNLGSLTPVEVDTTAPRGDQAGETAPRFPLTAQVVGGMGFSGDQGTWPSPSYRTTMNGVTVGGNLTVTYRWEVLSVGLSTDLLDSRAGVTGGRFGLHALVLGRTFIAPFELQGGVGFGLTSDNPTWTGVVSPILPSFQVTGDAYYPLSAHLDLCARLQLAFRGLANPFLPYGMGGLGLRFRL